MEIAAAAEKDQQLRKSSFKTTSSAVKALVEQLLQVMEGGTEMHMYAIRTIGYLARMFPAKETVFHHLGRYLFHPTNTVWGMIRRYHTAYLAGSDEKIGIQIRVFSRYPISPENYLKQILMCSQQERRDDLTGVRAGR